MNDKDRTIHKDTTQPSRDASRRSFELDGKPLTTSLLSSLLNNGIQSPDLQIRFNLMIGNDFDSL